MNFFNQKQHISGVGKNKFDLGHERKMSLNVGHLVPMYVQDVMPGDSFRVNSEIFLRFAPMLAPIMHRVDVYTHYFYVPNRLLWEEWETFITRGEDGLQEPAFPTINLTLNGPFSPTLPNWDDQWGIGTLADYMGIGYTKSVGAANPTNYTRISALPFRAYLEIYNEWYRDQNVEPKITYRKNGGDQTAQDQIESTWEVANKLLVLRQRAWEKDYFTTALPWPQRGPTAFAPIDLYSVNDATPVTPGPVTASLAGDGLHGRIQDGASNNLTGMLLINELRKANALTLWLEKQARGGGRLTETILTQFGVKSSDSRLQRPEYLGGGRQHVKISEVLSTFENSAADLPQGNMSGHGISSSGNHGFKQSFEEHGYIIGIMSVMPRSAYQQGIERHWSYSNVFDFPWPAFAELGEQAVLQKELYFDPTAPLGQGEETFGYQSRYAEHKFKLSSNHGDMRENLSFWTGDRIFDAPPILNNNFIKMKNYEFDRVFAVVDPSTHKLWCHIYNSVDALRPLPYFGTPKLS